MIFVTSSEKHLSQSILNTIFLQTVSTMTQHSMSYRIESDDDGLASTLKRFVSLSLSLVAFWESLTKKIQIKKETMSYQKTTWKGE
jgi:hypothetical protein